MSEIDLIQAYNGSIGLAYTTSTWWLTISTALVVAIYFAARHIPPWLMAVSVVLYAVTALSVLWELHLYSSMATNYAAQLVAIDFAKGHASRFAMDWNLGYVNTYANYGVLVLGSLAAAAFAFVTWRTARHAAGLEKPRFQRQQDRKRDA
ncbi:MAG TPA: hypothetical protein VHL34_09705 [Rhizomicrobium sp.]|jgi:hypothetical protein|nr:hypothetical protein [Rhizomicrobium sp.]